MLAAALVPMPTWAHDDEVFQPGSTQQSPQTEIEHDSGGLHNHKIVSRSNLASPVHGASYSRSNGNIEVESGAYHAVYFWTSRTCYPLVRWHGWVDCPGEIQTSSGSEDSGGDINPDLDEDGWYRHYFLVSNEVDVSQLANTEYDAEAFALIYDNTTANFLHVYSQHFHTFEIIP